MKLTANFVTAEERRECLLKGKVFQPQSLVEYLRIEPILDLGITLKAKLHFRHSSLYHLEMSDWTYLQESDLRSIGPIVDFREKNRPCYLTFGKNFFEVTDIHVDESKTLIFSLQEANGWCLN